MNQALIGVSVHGFVLQEDKSFLLVQRAGYDTRPGMWEMPGGGLEVEEDPAEAAPREVLEETGLQVIATDVLLIKNYYYPERQKHTLRIAYLCEIGNNANEVVLSNDHSVYQWVNRSTLTDFLLSDFTKAVIERLRQKMVI